MLSKDEWISVLTILRNLINENIFTRSQDAQSRIATYYAVLGYLYDDKDFLSLSSEFVDNFDLYHKLSNYNQIASLITCNPRYTDQATKHYTYILDMTSNAIDKASEREIQAESFYLLYLESIFKNKFEPLFDIAIDLYHKIVQTRKREDQITHYYTLVEYLIASGRKERAIEFFSLAEEKYKALMSQSDKIESIGINHIRLERSIKTHDINAIIKLFYYFKNLGSSVILQKSFPTLKILDYLFENKHTKIFYNFLNELVSYFHVKEDQHQWESLDEVSLQIPFLSSFFEHAKKWDCVNLLELMKSMYNYEISNSQQHTSGTLGSHVWDIRYFLAKLQFGYLSRENFEATITHLAHEFRELFNYIHQNLNLIIAPNKEFNTIFSNFNMNLIKINNILEFTKSIDKYNSIKILRNMFEEVTDIIATDFNKAKEKQDYETTQRILSLARFIDMKKRVIIAIDCQIKNEQDFYYPIWSEEFKNSFRMPYSYFNSLENLKSFFSNNPDIEKIRNILVEFILYAYTNDNIKVTNLIQDLDAFFRSIPLQINDKVRHFFEPHNPFTDKKVDLHNEEETQNFIDYYKISLFLEYVKILVDTKQLYNSNAINLLNPLIQDLSNSIKLEYAYVSVQSNYLDLGDKLLQSYLQHPTAYDWKEDESDTILDTPSVQLNIGISTQRVRTLRHLGFKEQAVEELTSIIKSTYISESKIDPILKEAIKLEQVQIIHNLLDIVFNKIFKNMESESIKGKVYCSLIQKRERPDYCPKDLWHKIHEILLSKLKTAYPQFVKNPFSVQSFRLLMEIIKYYYLFGEKKLSLNILNKCENILLMVTKKTFSEEILNKLPNFSVDESFSKEEIISISDMLENDLSKSGHQKEFNILKSNEIKKTSMLLERGSSLLARINSLLGFTTKENFFVDFRLSIMKLLSKEIHLFRENLHQSEAFRIITSLKTMDTKFKVFTLLKRIETDPHHTHLYSGYLFNSIEDLLQETIETK